MADILATPGPCSVPPQALEVLGQPVIHHRTVEFEQVFAQVLSSLKAIFQTRSPVLVHAATGTGAMESLLVNLHSPGDTVLVLSAGKFGQRWEELAKAYGLHPLAVKAPWGQSPSPAEVEQTLNQHPEVKSVFVQACETSTGQRHPVQEYARITSSAGPLLLVDAISAVGAYDLPMDDWKIDGLIGGSQKAFMAPTGLSLIALSEKAWQAQKKATLPRYYFDLSAELKAAERGQTRFSSPVSLLKSLNASMDQLLQKGLPHLFQWTQQRKSFAVDFLAALGLRQFPQEPSPSLTVVQLPDGLDGQALQKLIHDKYQVVFIGGQDELRGKVLRWSHMGHSSWQEQILIARALASGLEDAGAKLPEGWRDWLREKSEQLL